MKFSDDTLLPIFSEIKYEEKGTENTKSAPDVPSLSVKKVIRKAPAQLKSPSIKDALAGKFGEEKLSAKAQHAAYTKVSEINHFTEEALSQKWNEFLKRLDDRPNLQSTLSKVPLINADYQLVLNIDNSVQEDLINSVRPELVAWLRKELRNSKIQVITSITETEKEKLIYTDSERYLELLKINPNLELLKQKFKLDFE